MADLRKVTHGEGALKDVNLVFIAYDNRVARKDGEITTHYLDARIHPDDRRAPGQVSLALNAKRDPKAPSGFNNSTRYSVGQFEAIQKAAGDNAVDLKNTAGEVVGKIYGAKADLIINNGEIVANTKTLEPTELSVADVGGRDIRTRMYDLMKEAKAAKAAANAAPEAEAEATVEEPTVEAPVAEKPAAKPRTATKRTTTTKAKAPKPELVGATVGAPASDEPELG